MTTADGQADAKRFPCPPTAAEIAKGDACVVAIGDTSNDKGVGVVLFGAEALPKCPAVKAKIPSACTPHISKAVPASLAVGAKAAVTFSGAGFGVGSKLTFSGPSTKVTAVMISIAYSTYKATVTVPTGTPVGKYNVKITNSNTAFSICTGCFTVS